MAMDFGDFLPRHQHAGLVWLGKQNGWFRASPMEGKELRTKVQADFKGLNIPQEHSWLKMLPKTFDVAPLGACVIEAMSRCLCDSPKMFIPSHEQFEAMSHVDMRIPIKEYKQPYPAMLVKIPTETKRQLAEQHNFPMEKMPKMVLLRWMDTSPTYIYSCSRFYPLIMGEQHYLITDREEFKTLEDALGTYGWFDGPLDFHDQQMFDINRSLVRSCMNLMLLLTHYGCSDGGPLDPHAYKKHREKKSLNHLMHADIRTVLISQEIKVREVKYESTDKKGHPGIEVKPHWRRGHWRNQRCGKGLQESKRLFIRPVLIRSDRAVGELAETQVTYRG